MPIFNLITVNVGAINFFSKCFMSSPTRRAYFNSCEGLSRIVMERDTIFDVPNRAAYESVSAVSLKHRRVNPMVGDVMENCYPL